MNTPLNRSEYRQKAHGWRQNKSFDGIISISPSVLKRKVECDIEIALDAPKEIPQGTLFICYFTECPKNQPQVKTPNDISDFMVKYKHPIMEFTNEENIPKGENIFIALQKVIPVIRTCIPKFEIFIKFPGKEFSLFAPPYIFKKETIDAESIQLYVSQNTEGGKLRISLAAEQPQDHFYLPDENFEEIVELELPWKKAKHKFKKSDHGIISIEENLPVSHPTSFEIGANVVSPGSNLCAHSGTIETSFFPDGEKAFFGDMHLHSNLSDGYGDPEELLKYARGWKRLDFIALNEHIENSLCWKMGGGKEKWAHYKTCIDKYNISGEFITIGGFEYRSFCNLWCFNDEYINELDPVLFNGPEEEAEIYKRIDGFTKRENWLVGYHRLETLYKPSILNELPSPNLLQLAHGKRPPEIGSLNFIERGDMCGFFGATDTHFGIPGHVFPGLPRNGQSGLTAVITSDLSRGGLYKALKNRRCYSTMGSRHLVDFQVNGAMMGDIIRVSPLSPITIKLRAHGKEKIGRVDLVKNGINIKTNKINNSTLKIIWNDPDKFHTDCYYFVRLTLEDGRMIWTSPIWLKTSL